MTPSHLMARAANGADPHRRLSEAPVVHNEAGYAPRCLAHGPCRSMTGAITTQSDLVEVNRMTESCFCSAAHLAGPREGRVIVGFALTGLVVEAVEAKVVVGKMPLQTDKYRAWAEYRRWNALAGLVGSSGQVGHMLAQIIRHQETINDPIAILSWVGLAYKRENAQDLFGAWEAYTAASAFAQRLSRGVDACRKRIGLAPQDADCVGPQANFRQANQEVSRCLGHLYEVENPLAVARRHTFDLGWYTLKVMARMLPSNFEGARLCSHQTLRSLAGLFGDNNSYVLAFVSDSSVLLGHQLEVSERRDEAAGQYALAFRALTLFPAAQLEETVERRLTWLGTRLQARLVALPVPAPTDNIGGLLMNFMQSPGSFA